MDFALLKKSDYNRNIMKEVGPKRVLHVMRSLEAGGIGAFIMNVYRTIDRSQIQFDFAITSDGMGVFGPEIEQMGGRIFFIYNEGNRNIIDGIRQIFNLYMVCKKNRYDAVHCHYYYGNAYFLLCAKLAGVRKLVSHCHTAKTLHTNFFKQAFEFVSRRILLKVGTDFLGCADAATVFLYGEKAFKSGKAKTLYNGIDYNIWNIDNFDIEKLRLAYGLKSEKVAIFVGRMEEVKNPIYALRVIKEVYGHEPDIRMFFVGTGSLDSEVDRFIRDNKMSGYVTRMPQDANIRELQALADVMIAPSLREGLSIAFIEAQKMNTYIVTSDAVSDEVDMGLCSFLNLEKLEDWVECVLWHFCGKDKRSISKHYEDFDVNTTVSNLLDIYFGDEFHSVMSRPK